MAQKRVKKEKETIVFDVENEQIILSQMLKSIAVRKRCSRELSEQLFIGTRHKIIFQVLSMMVSRGLDYNKDTFKTLSNDEDFGGFKYLEDLEELFEENTNIDFHIERLKLDSKKISLKKKKVKELNEALEDPQVDGKELSIIVRDISEDLRDIFITTNIHKGKELKKEYFDTLKQRQEVGTFIGTGFVSLDEDLTEGLARKKTSVWAARTSMGKTTALSNMVDYLRSIKVQTLVMPLESGKESFIDLMVSRRTKIPLINIIKRMSELTVKEKTLIKKETSAILDDEYLHFIDDTSTTLNDLRTILDNNNYEVCFIDLFEKLADVSFDSKVMSNKLKEVQKIAKEADVHMGLLAQIKRNPDIKAKDKRPTLELLKHSGAFEENADLVMFFHREYYYNSEVDKDVLEMIIAKQRMGIRNKSYYYDFIPDVMTVGKEALDYVPFGEDF